MVQRQMEERVKQIFNLRWIRDFVEKNIESIEWIEEDGEKRRVLVIDTLFDGRLGAYIPGWVLELFGQAEDYDLEDPYNLEKNETIYDALEYLVYPACAGIDLQSTAYEAWVLCLPRMRGDRPGIYPCFFPVIPFTPHARGSTLKEGMMVRVLPVYPACAGIDLM